MSKYFGCFDSYEDMVGGFGLDKNDLPASFPRAEDVLFASYEQESYEGSAVVIYLHNNVLMETTSGHCSCNGLEWTPGTPITWAYLRHAIDNDTLYGMGKVSKEFLVELVNYAEFHREFDQHLAN